MADMNKVYDDLIIINLYHVRTSLKKFVNSTLGNGQFLGHL